MIGLWITGLLRHRGGRLLVISTGIAITVGLIATLGSFLSQSRAAMTARALHSVSVPWQVEVQRGADPSAIAAQLGSTPAVGVADRVLFAPVTGLAANTGGTSQQTGAGTLVGLDTASYEHDFPGAVRSLAGAPDGVLVAQQTAANLHVQPGDDVAISLGSGASAAVTVNGVVDLPQADSFFQKVGAAATAQPSAPPDNVVIVPPSTFSDLTASVPALVTTQFHTTLRTTFSPDPATAYSQVTAQARNVEATAAGAVLVGDNVGAALDAARSDATYATLLFAFLGLPGAVLAALLTAVLVASGAQRRRAEQSLLRTRGLSHRAITGLAVVEALIVGLLGSALGLGAALASSRFLLGDGNGANGAATPTSVVTTWFIVAMATGFAVAGLTILLPTVRDLRGRSVKQTGRTRSTARTPLALRFGLDAICLTGAWLVYRSASAATYSLVLAPEGVPQIQVNYTALLGPALLWLGGALLCWRVALLALQHGRRPLAVVLRPLTERLHRHAAASVSRRGPVLAQAVVLLTCALAFAASTSIFNATYAQQAEADAQLTNGADVTVTAPSVTALGPDVRATIAGLPGVQAVEPLQHRFAYVGADLQDLYGVEPRSISSVTALRDAYFTGGSAAQLLARLAEQPTSILVSAETVKDFQLTLGDTVNLRIQDATTHQLTTVPFTFAGVVNEFPTAPKDSFFVANADYVARATGSGAVGALLVDTGGVRQPDVAARIRQVVGRPPLSPT